MLKVLLESSHRKKYIYYKDILVIKDFFFMRATNIKINDKETEERKKKIKYKRKRKVRKEKKSRIKEREK